MIPATLACKQVDVIMRLRHLNVLLNNDNTTAEEKEGIKLRIFSLKFTARSLGLTDDDL